MSERVLNACPACDRQYDVSHLSAGEGVRCDCGERFTTRRPSPISARVVRCSGCSGDVPLGARTCPYCGVEITADDRGLGVRCPKCLAKARARDTFCGACGTELSAHARPAVPEERSCPRCEGVLQGHVLDGGLPIVECTACAGVWLNPETFEVVLQRGEQDARAEAPRVRGHEPPPVEVETEVRYLPCVGCGELMTRKRIGGAKGATVDVCRAHGLWFDAGELERILAWVRAGGKAATPWRPREEKRVTPPFAGIERAHPARADRGWWERPGTGGDLLDVLFDLFTRF